MGDKQKQPSTLQTSLQTIKSAWPSILDKGRFTLKLICTILIYGFLASLVLNQLIGHEITWGKVVAYGLLAYALKFELPQIVSSSIPRPPQIRI